MRTRLVVLSALLGVLLTVFVPAAQAQSPTGGILIAALSGDEEEPDDGDSDGYGAAYVYSASGGRLCARISAQGIDAATMGHIHRGARGVAGPVVVPLFMGAVPGGVRCVTVARALRIEIARFPARFYVNVHNADFPAGAIRGQLSR
jgi:hypothetical protein